ncbi:unnamed protein product [Soboliphyme baturini]|uniref:Zf-LYAR domain-containing protein n=1 Tax=Soboliphyme baturini TaxID=241478 RepID=A0A183IV24_9BILA|nr:unnamed protein product [Soboliphyme baturini]
MVFFTCNGCGESVKKASVEKHKIICRRSYTISCMDCGKDFNGQEYQAHTKCVSEAQKYDMKGDESIASKGDLKQQLWTEQVQRAIASTESSNSRLIDALQQLRDFPNIPRKKAKFKNFLLNSSRIRNPLLIDQLWDAISSADVASKSNGNSNDANKSDPNCDSKANDSVVSDSKPVVEASENGFALLSTDKTKKTAASMKSAVFEDGETVFESPAKNGKKLKIKPILKRILAEAPNNEMKFKKLKKMVYSAIPCQDDEAIPKDVVYNIVERHVSNSSKFLLDGKKVRLVVNTAC